MQELFRLVLKRQNLTTDFLTASDGGEGLGLVSRVKPDLILLDIMMPTMDGIETLGHLKANPEVSHVPVIVVSAKTERAVIDRCMQLGAANYLAKPVPILDLVAAVQQALGSAG
jgi:CheY-like chemotaxis protein